ncbi:unnamed protein product [Blepharisma stoltei]|uniref:DUF676 domain-containing protein n=1 Tax=Blepharisma stoltei TaxID=1481888 RepID=A0AAU9K549_9CILI|nr:unnamed protein product [Blepharisma stoltei]
MALKSVLEIVIQLDTYKNIDLYQQGLYQLQISCYYMKNDRRVYAVPISLSNIKTKDINPIKLNPHDILPGSLNENKKTVKSRVFLIRYSEEKVKLNEISTFQLYMKLPKNKSEQGLIIQLDLLFKEIPGKKPILDNLVQLAREGNFQTVKTCRYNISNPLKGIHEYFPGLFNSEYFSNVDGIIHAVFYDYKLTEDESSDFMNFLFKDKKGKIKAFIGGGEIDRKYDEYVTNLVEVHEGIRILIEKIKTEYEFLNIEVPQPLKLPLLSENLDENEGSFAEKLNSHDPYVISVSLLREIKLIAGCIYQAFMVLREIIIKNSRKSLKFFKFFYEEKIMERCAEFCIKEEGRNWNQIWYNNEAKKEHTASSIKIRENPYFSNLEPLTIQDTAFFSNIATHPILYEQVCYPDSLSSNMFSEKVYRKSLKKLPIRKIEDLHIIVLVHGFQGNSNDLKILKNYISLVYTKCFFLESNLNETKTDGDIKEMGFRLAKELVGYLSEWCPDEAPRISFIGHSLGGLIIRAALPYLDALSDKMQLYLSLSTPHLGLMNSSKLLDAGIWFLKFIKRVLSLKQLCLQDYHIQEGTFIYQLSLSEGLEWFKYVVLISSAQDEYAPFESARIEVPGIYAKELSSGSIYAKMVENILRRLSNSFILKLDVNFKLEQSLDTIIGRSAHMQLLENHEFLRMLVYRYPQFFE